jgi:hypothetical protein
MTTTNQFRTATLHTPGPWVYTLDAYRICGIHQANNATGLPVKIAEVESHSQQQAEANARLIASAPDLLAALALWIAGAPLDEFDQAARSAITKAQGRPV